MNSFENPNDSSESMLEKSKAISQLEEISQSIITSQITLILGVLDVGVKKFAVSEEESKWVSDIHGFIVDLKKSRLPQVERAKVDYFLETGRAILKAHEDFHKRN